jgi:hypothetical protein
MLSLRDRTQNQLTQFHARTLSIFKWLNGGRGDDTDLRIISNPVLLPLLRSETKLWLSELLIYKAVFVSSLFFFIYLNMLISELFTSWGVIWAFHRHLCIYYISTNFSTYVSLIMGLCILLRVLSRIVSKTVLRNECWRCFLFILFIPTCFGLSDCHPQVNRTFKEVAIPAQRIRRDKEYKIKTSWAFVAEDGFTDKPYVSLFVLMTVLVQEADLQMTLCVSVGSRLSKCECLCFTSLWRCC